MVKLNRKQMEEKLKLVMEFMRVPEEDAKSVDREQAQKSDRNS